MGQLGGADDTEFSVEGIEGDWFDDDFWTSADTKKKQQQLKAEEERLAAEVRMVLLSCLVVSIRKKTVLDNMAVGGCQLC